MVTSCSGCGKTKCNHKKKQQTMKMCDENVMQFGLSFFLAVLKLYQHPKKCLKLVIGYGSCQFCFELTCFAILVDTFPGTEPMEMVVMRIQLSIMNFGLYKQHR